MKIEQSTVKKLKITAIKNIDPITVILEDIEQSKGKIIIECYGKSWSSYWGGMGNRTIAEFFCSCDEHYLAKNLSTISNTVEDFEALTDVLKKNICKMRRQNELDTDDARELYKEAELTCQYHSTESLHAAHSGIMYKVIGEEWWYAIPTKVNPEYEYLCRIINVVQQALSKIKLQ